MTILRLNLPLKRMGNQVSDDRVRRVVTGRSNKDTGFLVLTVKYSARSRGEWRGARHLRQKKEFYGQIPMTQLVASKEATGMEGGRKGPTGASEEMRARGTRSSLSRLVVS